jgi:hypothetical protein
MRCDHPVMPLSTRVGGPSTPSGNLRDPSQGFFARLGAGADPGDDEAGLRADPGLRFHGSDLWLALDGIPEESLAHS